MKRTWPAAGSVRLRLTLWYLAAIAAVLGMYAVGVFSLVRNSLRDGLDQQLHEDFEAAEALLEPAANGTIVWKARPHVERDADDRRIEVWNGTQLLLRFPEDERGPFDALPLGPFDSADLAQGRQGRQGGQGGLAEESSVPVAPPGYQYASVSRPNGSYARTITGPFRIGDRRLVMRISRSEEPIRHKLRDLGIVLGIAWPVALALAGIGGYLLARRTLAPVDQMAERARSITADRLDPRLPVENPRDASRRSSG